MTAMYSEPEERDISLDKRLEMYAESGDEPPVFTFTHTSRGTAGTHAVQRGVDIHAEATLGHSSSATTGHYVAANFGQQSSASWLVN